MQVQVLFLSWAIQWEETEKVKKASCWPGRTRWRWAGGRLLLLVVVAGTGSPTPDLTAELLYQLWVLLLHLLSKLLARLDETGQVILRGAGAGSPQGVVAARNHARHELLNLGIVHQV